MKQTLTTYQIAGLLMADENASWTRSAAYALAEYYQELEESAGEEIEFDQVAIRCDWSFYGTLEEAAENYSIPGLENTGDEKERNEAIKEWILDRGQLITIPDGSGFLISNF